MPKSYAARIGPRARLPLRIDPSLLARLTAFAEAAGRSANAEIIDRLESSLKCQCRPSGTVKVVIQPSPPREPQKVHVKVLAPERPSGAPPDAMTTEALGELRDRKAATKEVTMRGARILTDAMAPEPEGVVFDRVPDEVEP